MIASGDNKDIDGAVVEDAAEIGDDARRPAVIERLHDARRSFRPALIDVADIGDFDAGLRLESSRKFSAAAAGAHDADDKAARGFVLSLCLTGGAERHAGGGGGGEEVAAVERVGHDGIPHWRLIATYEKPKYDRLPHRLHGIFAENRINADEHGSLTQSMSCQ